MSLLPYVVIGGALLVALVAAIVTGELAVFLVVLPIVAIYAVVDRRLQQREPGDDRLARVRPRE